MKKTRLWTLLVVITLVLPMIALVPGQALAGEEEYLSCYTLDYVEQGEGGYMIHTVGQQLIAEGYEWEIISVTVHEWEQLTVNTWQYYVVYHLERCVTNNPTREWWRENCQTDVLVQYWQDVDVDSWTDHDDWIHVGHGDDGYWILVVGWEETTYTVWYRIRGAQREEWLECRLNLKPGPQIYIGVHNGTPGTVVQTVGFDPVYAGTVDPNGNTWLWMDGVRLAKDPDVFWRGWAMFKRADTGQLFNVQLQYPHSTYYFVLTPDGVEVSVVAGLVHEGDPAQIPFAEWTVVYQ